MSGGGGGNSGRRELSQRGGSGTELGKDHSPWTLGMTNGICGRATS